VALSPDDYINLLLLLSLLFPTNSHQLNPTNLRLCVGLYADVCADEKSPILLLFTPQIFYFHPNFSRKHPACTSPVIGVDVPPPIYSGRKWWKRTKNYQTSNKTLCVCTLYRNMTVHYKGIEYKDDGPCRGRLSPPKTLKQDP